MANVFDRFDTATAQNPFDRFDPGYQEPDGPGDLVRGAKVAFGQTGPLAKGLVGLAGATAEKAFGEGGIATGVKNWGLRGFTEGMERLRPLQKDTDELTTAWDRAKEGDLGALVDWAQYGLGYAIGQGGEAVAVAVLGGVAGAAAAPAAAPVAAAGGAVTGLVAKGAVKEAATALIRRAVVREANTLLAGSAGKLTAQEAVRQATRSIARDIGSTAALLVYGGAQELGSIYPEAEAEAARSGEELSGADLARVWASGIAAGGLEGLTDKLGIGALTGKVRLPGTGRVGSAVAAGLGGAVVEGVTEAAQTGIERFGAGQEVLSEAGQRDIINAAGLGALGGGAIGGGVGLVRGPADARADDAFRRIADAPTVDDALKAFTETYVPVELPPGLDGDGALARLERENQRTEASMRDFSAARPSTPPRVVPGMPPELQRPAAPAGPTVEAVPEEPFGDRLLTIREQLKDSRLRQQIRDELGPEALNDVLYYSQQADNVRLPGRTSDRMLALAEAIVSRAQFRPIPNQPQAGAPTEVPQIGAAAVPAVPQIGLDTTPTGVLRVDPAGVAVPEVAADLVSDADRARAAMPPVNTGMEGSFPQGAPARPGVLVGPGRVVPQEPHAAAEPLALPEPAPYRQPATPEERAAAFERAEADAENARRSQTAAIPELARQQTARAAAVERAAQLDAPGAMQAALARAGLAAPAGASTPTDAGPVAAPAEPVAGRIEEITAAADQAATSPTNDLPEPTDAQKEAGNYKKGHVTISGLDVSIENPKGSIRRSKADAPKPWQVTMPAAYGYIRGTRGADGDHVDISIGPAGENGRFWVINQVHADTKRFDEHKVFTGVDSAEEAVALYKAGFADGFGDKVFSSVSVEFDADGFKAQLPYMDRPEPVLGSMRARAQRLAAAGRQPSLGERAQAMRDRLRGAGAPAQPAAPGPGSLAERAARMAARQEQQPGQAAAAPAAPAPAPAPAPAQQRPPLKDRAGAMKQRLRATAAPTEPAAGAPAPPTPPARQAAPATQETPAAAKAPARIEDFGEELKGARKMLYAQAYADALRGALDVDVAANPLSKSWPEPDYAKLLESGVDPWSVAFVHAARDHVPTKPQSSWKLKAWVENVTSVRNFADKLLSGTWKRDAVELFTKSGTLNDLRGRIELYQALGHEKSLKGINLRAASYSMFNGKAYSPAKTMWTVERTAKASAFGNWPRQLAVGETKEQVIDAFKAFLAKQNPQDEVVSRAITFELYSRRGDKPFFIGKKVGSNVLEIQGGFATAKEAREYLATHRAELEAKLARMKEIPSERKESNAPRVGTDHRMGADVTAKQFADAFGFRGVQFGNYVEGSRRQQDLNQAFDALMDLAGVLGVPPRALSLNGQLGLAFGARGRGGKGAPSAHFERGTAVINLTKAAGAGSLAHEWWHSLDNYFARMGGDKLGMMTGGARANDAVRREMKEAFDAVDFAIRATAVKQRSAELDKRRSSPYWTKPHEMSARSFESYVIAKLADQGASNDYLANVVSGEAFDAAFGMPDSYPYPLPAELPNIRAAFDRFFATVETAPTPDGGVVLREPTSDLELDDADQPGAGLPDAVIGHPLAAATRHRDYASAKAGDPLAAIRLARDLVTDDMVAAVAETIGGGGAIIQPVVSQEAAGRNKIPAAVAEVLADRLGQVAGTGIGQRNVVQRSAMGGLDRLFAAPRFDGAVKAGARYVIVDDTITQGGTFAALGQHIRAGGGEVVGVVALTGKSYSAKLTLSPQTLREVRERFADVETAFRAATGRGFDGLTESEARYLAKHDNPDAVRVRIAAEGRRAGPAGDERGAGEAGDLTLREPDRAPEAGGPAVAGPAGVDAVRGAGDPVHRRARIAGLGIAADIQRAGSAALVGQRVSGPDVLAGIAQVYRDPRYETFRVFFVKGGTIVHATGVSARMPGHTPMIPAGMSPARYFDWFRREMARTGADGYYVLHNHPSGDPTPSQDDFATTRNLSNQVAGMLGHVVINSNRYAVIEPGAGGVRVVTQNFGPDLLLRAGKPLAALGRSIRHPSDLVEVGKSMQRPGWLTLIGYDAHRLVRVVAEAPASTLTRSPMYLAGLVRRLMRQSGSRWVSVAGEAEVINSQPVRDGVLNGLIEEAVAVTVAADNRSLRQQGVEPLAKAFTAVQGRTMASPTDDDSAWTRMRTGIRGFDQAAARNLFLDATANPGKLGLWARTIGTQYAKAQRHPETFGRVFDAVQDYIKDISAFANAAAERAPSILPKLEQFRDLKKGGLTRLTDATPQDLQAAGSVIFQGTLSWARDAGGKLVPIDDATAAAARLSTADKAGALLRGNRIGEGVLKMWQGQPQERYEAMVADKYEREFLRAGVVFTGSELRKLGLTGPQIDLYREFRAAVDQSLDDLARSEMLRMAGADGGAVRARVLAAPTLADAAAVLRTHFDELAAAAPDRKDSLDKTADSIADKSVQVDRLKQEGYAPLMRFGRHTLHIQRDGETLFFGMYESRREANRAAREMQGDPQFKGAKVSRGLMSQEAYKLYSGLPIDALELFANTTGNADNEVYQDFLRLTKGNRSALKRMIHRQGIAGFSEDTSRVLAAFVTSNARLASGNLHLGAAKEAADAIPKEQGDLKDDAVRLVQYVQDPQEEAAAVRGLLFANFIGGSVASAAVNLTQPLTMTLPYLSQWGGVVKAGQHILAAAKTAAAGQPAGEIGEALARAERDGIVSPQEIHHLQAEAMNRLGNHPVLKKAAFIWGSMFSLSEQFNRRVSFIAAYNTAKEQHVADPFAFAEKAVVETQGLYNKGNKPNWARGPIGATVMTFKQFSIHYLEFLRRMWTDGGRDGKKAVGVALGILMMVAGAGGLPFADDLDDAVDTLAQALGYDFSSKAAKRRFIAETLGLGNVAADVATRGLSSLPGFPIDVSLRMGLGNLMPGTGALLRSNTDRSADVLEFAGAAGGLARNAMDAGTKLLSGEVARAGLAMAPVALQNMGAALTMWNTGEYRNRRDQRVMDVGPVDAAMKAIGFQPAEVARESAAMREVQRSVQLVRNVESEIAAKWARGLNDNDPAVVQDARRELADWNRRNPESPMRITMQQVIRRVREMQRSRAERAVRSAPAELREKVREAF